MNPKAILPKLEVSIGINGAPRRLRTAIEMELRESFRLGDLRAAELAEELEKSIALLIQKIQAEKEANGVAPVLSLSSVSSRAVMGSCWIEPTDSTAIAKAKEHRLHSDAFLAEIKNLTFTEFELFGARVLKELGASTVSVTPHSDDQGIDFYGVLSIGEFGGIPGPFLQLARDVQLRFAGQAKHYPNTPIGPSEIRELVGAIALARHKIFTNGGDVFEDLGLRAFNPLLALFFTTGRFTSGARELARKAGIIARSGEQLALFLAERGVGMVRDDIAVKFDRDLFRRWLNN